MNRLLTFAMCCLICLGHASDASATKSPRHPAGKSTGQPEPIGRPYALRTEVMAQATDIAERRQLDPQWTHDMLAQAHMLPSVARLMLPPARGQKKNWAVYRSRFIDPVRIAAGVRFWQANQAWLSRAEASYGVSADILVGIIGVETIYGQQTGTYRVLDALATLAFDFPQAHPRAAARQAYFRDELEQFLTLMQRGGGDPLSVRGSYAGAIGMPQFMPSSIAKYAVDFDGDGKIDLTRSPADVIGSVANYFKNYGWTTGMPTHFSVQFDPDRLDLDALLAPDILPSFSAAALQSKGALLEAAGQQHTGLLALVELQMGEQPARYVAGTSNFYTITRYNWSSYYAMAVIELGQAVARAAHPGP